MKSKVFACQNTDEKERYNSSSGGIFPLLAKEVLKADGVVYGAAFTENFMVRHIAIESISDIQKITGSKYVYSSLEGVFPQIKKELELGRKVAFCGTPCQISALRSFLKNKYENLLLIDFICHGTPLPGLWKKYLEEISNGRKIKNINFRDKSRGWSDYCLKIEFSDGTYYIEDHGKDPYIKGFVYNLILREACYTCRHKGVDERQSDITLGDLWGAEELCPILFDNMGTSLLMIHTELGQQYFDSIARETIVEIIDVERALSINWAAIRHVDPSKYIMGFRREYERTNNLTHSLEKYVNPSVLHKILCKLQNNKLFNS